MILGLHTANPSSTAVLYFTRSADIEARRKSLVPNDAKRNRKVVKALIDHTESIIERSGLSYFLSDSDNSLHSFGEKLASNVDYVFAQGYTNLVIVGNDCPTLTTEDIHIAANQLRHGYDTYGRSHDGGLYLIGIQQESYHREIFKRLPWSSDSLGDAFDNYLNTYSRELHSVSLQIKADLDSSADFSEFIKTSDSCSTICAIIWKILHDEKIQIITIDYYFLDRRHHDSYSLRGPPQLAA